jgi:3-phenylpropionate/cinnamic acid dioxygenase small subunit
VGVSSSNWRAAATLDVLDVLAQLARCCDFGTVDDYLELVAEHGTWDMPDNPQVGVAASRRVGRDAIRTGVEERRAAGFQGPGTNTLHVIGSVAVDVAAPTEARARSYWLYYARTATTPELRSVGQYDDRFVRTGEGWRLFHRRISVG